MNEVTITGKEAIQRAIDEIAAVTLPVRDAANANHLRTALALLEAVLGSVVDINTKEANDHDLAETER